MRALQISHGGTILVTAGTPQATLLTCSLAWPVDEKWPRLDIGGMNKYGDGRMSHPYWFMELALQPGHTLELRLVETGVATPLEEERFTDTDDYRADQAEFASTLIGPQPPHPPLERLAPQASLTLHLASIDPIAADLGDGREWLFFNCMWGDHAPDECRISLASKGSNEIQARRGGHDWFRGKLKLGESCRIDIGGSQGVN